MEAPAVEDPAAEDPWEDLVVAVAEAASWVTRARHDAALGARGTARGGAYGAARENRAARGAGVAVEAASGQYAPIRSSLVKEAVPLCDL